MSTISFKPKQVTKRITSHLHDRASDVVMNRFGLTADAKKKTLEEIGEKYNITRERVRQIEDAALTSIKKSEMYKAEQAVFDELKQLISSLGSVVAEHDFLSHVSNDKATQNHIHFYLVLGDAFWLKESVSNFIENSIKYTKQGKIIVWLEKQDGKILFSVKAEINSLLSTILALSTMPSFI